MEGSDEEEALRDEEEEALRLQRSAAAALHADDFGGDEEKDDSSDEDDEPALGTLRDGKLKSSTGKTHVEKISRSRKATANDEEEEEDDDALYAAAVRQDALELKALTAELQNVLGEVRGRLGPLLREIKEGDFATAEGLSYLEAKHTLLVHYAASIVFYLLLKAEGKSVKDHPVVHRLVEIRSYIEKIRPIDKRLQYQIEKLLAVAQQSNNIQGDDAAGDGALSFRPRPEALLAPTDAAGGKARKSAAAAEDLVHQDGAPAAEGAYRPPKINPVSMEDDVLGEDGAKALAKQRRKEAMQVRRAARSSLVQELAAELAGAPEEQRAAPALGMDTAAALKERQRQAAREAVEEELMVRVPLSREERKKLKAQRRAGLSGKALLDDFADDVADILQGSTDGGWGPASDASDPVLGRRNANQKFGADLAEEAMRVAPRSGDDDLPVRQSLEDRRARMDGTRAKKRVLDEYNDGDNGGDGGEEDDFYKAAKATATEKKKRKASAYAYDELLPPAEDPTTRGARKINQAIEKNRGLTPHRRKDMKNPRKKHRVKYQEATVRRKGQVQEVRRGEAGGYGGEATGIKARVSKSVRF